jgi:hypothetical protein
MIKALTEHADYRFTALAIVASSFAELLANFKDN